MSKTDDVFISYASSEYSEADTVRSVLLTNGISCFMAPESIPGGSEYTKAIPKAIENCQVFVLILSDKSQKSKYVSDEVRLAFDGEKVVIPFAIEKCSLHEEFNFMIGRYQRIEAYQQKSYAMEKLVNNIKAVLDKPYDQEPQDEKLYRPKPTKPVVTENNSREAPDNVKRPNKRISTPVKIILAGLILAACSFTLYQFLFPKDFTYHVNYDFSPDTGEIVIAGDKRMPDYPSDHLEYREWNDDRDKIISAVFSEGLVNVGSYSFCYLSNLKSVRLPQSMTVIGEGAFLSCSELSDINLTDNITSIGDLAFAKCSLPDLTLPDSTISVGSMAFAYNSKLSRVYIPASVTQIDRMAFTSCNSLQSIGVSDQNLEYTSDNGNLYDRDKTTLYQYAIGNTDEEFNVPDGVTCIAEGAFSNDRYLTRVSLPDTVKEMQASAFSFCSNLKEISLSNNLSALGVYAFEGCEHLTDIELPDNVTEIPESAFEGCLSLKSVVLPENLESICKEAFSGCHNIESIIIPDTVTSIGEDAFFGCSDYLTIRCHNNQTVKNYAADHGIRFETI